MPGAKCAYDPASARLFSAIALRVQRNCSVPFSCVLDADAALSHVKARDHVSIVSMCMGAETFETFKPIRSDPGVDHD